MCEIYSTWKELVKQYDKLKAMRKRKDEAVRPTHPSIDAIRAMEKAAEVRNMIEEWLQNNEKYKNIYNVNSSKSTSEDDLCSNGGATKNKECTQTQERLTKTENPDKIFVNSKQYPSKNNTKTYNSRRNYASSQGRIKRDNSTNIRPHTAYIFTPADLNVAYINPIPWKKG